MLGEFIRLINQIEAKKPTLGTQKKRIRISQKEAAYILEILEKDKAYYEAFEQELKQKIQQLEPNVEKAAWLLRNFMKISAEKECNYPQCVVDLFTKEAQLAVTLRKLGIHKRLIAKYKRLAENSKGVGRYDHSTQEPAWDLERLHADVFLPANRYRAPYIVRAPHV
jgi:hypothetical protein